MKIGNAESRIGTRLAGYTEYEHTELRPDYDYLQKRAIIAYAQLPTRPLIVRICICGISIRRHLRETVSLWQPQLSPEQHRY
jgi:hypothetical protein